MKTAQLGRLTCTWQVEERGGLLISAGLQSVEEQKSHDTGHHYSIRQMRPHGVRLPSHLTSVENETSSNRHWEAPAVDAIDGTMRGLDGGWYPAEWATPTPVSNPNMALGNWLMQER